MDAFAANFPHQRGAIFMGARPMGYGVDKRALFVEDVGDQRNDAVDLPPAVGKASQKHRHVVVGTSAPVSGCQVGFNGNCRCLISTR